MANGILKLNVLDVYGQPIAESVDLLLRNQTLDHAPICRGLDGSKEIEITGLETFPNGTYRLEIDAPAYLPVSRFVNVPASGAVAVTATMPVNPKKVVAVKFPPYEELVEGARRLLENSSIVLNFLGVNGRTLYGALDNIRKAGFLNLVAKAGRTRFQSGRTVLSYLSELRELRGDRFFAATCKELRSEAKNSRAYELFHSADEILHTPPPGFERAGSLKTYDHFGNLQLSFFSNQNDEWMVDMDIDDAQGLEHLFQVVGNMFSGPTHPYNIHEILLASQELDPGYRLVVRETAVRAA